MKNNQNYNNHLKKSLDIITYYIKGNINLIEAIKSLSDLGHDVNSIEKVLKKTKRNNIHKLKKD